MLHEGRFAPLIYPEVFWLFPYPVTEKIQFFPQRVQAAPYGLANAALVYAFYSGYLCLAHAKVIVGIYAPQLLFGQLQQRGIQCGMTLLLLI